MEITGTLYKKMDTQQVTDNYQKRNFIIKVEGTYPEYVLMQVSNIKCNLLDTFKVGETLKCGINIKGKLWTNKQGEETVINNIEAWKINKL